MWCAMQLCIHQKEVLYPWANIFIHETETDEFCLISFNVMWNTNKSILVGVCKKITKRKYSTTDSLGTPYLIKRMSCLWVFLIYVTTGKSKSLLYRESSNSYWGEIIFSCRPNTSLLWCKDSRMSYLLL